MMLPLQVVSVHLPPERHPQSLNELKLQVDDDLQECLQHRIQRMPFPHVT